MEKGQPRIVCDPNAGATIEHRLHTTETTTRVHSTHAAVQLGPKELHAIKWPL